MECGGFDIVIANPPYYDIKGMPKNEVREYFKRFTTAEKRINLYAIFIEFGYSLLSEKGILCYINPNSLLVNESYQKLRCKIVDEISLIIKLPDAIFKQAVVETIIFLLQRGNLKENISAKYFKQNDKPTLVNMALMDFSREEWKQDIHVRFNIFVTQEVNTLLRKISDTSIPLGTIVDTSLGITPYDKSKGHTPEMIKNRVFHSTNPKSREYVALIEGRNIHAYSISGDVREYLKYGPWLGAPREERFFIEPRIIVRQVLGGTNLDIIAAYTSQRYYFTQIGFALIPKNGETDQAKYLTALLNSRLMSFYHKYTYLDPEKVVFPKILIANVKQLPYKQGKNYHKIVKLVDHILEQYSDPLSPILLSTQEEIDELIFSDYGLSNIDATAIKERY